MLWFLRWMIMVVLEGKVALVTGGSRGIGRAIVEALAEEKMNVVFTYVRGVQQADELERTYSNVRAVQADAGASDGHRATVDQVAGTYGGLHVLVNNAGIAEVMWPQDPRYGEASTRSHAVNCEGTAKYTDAALDVMKKAGSGDVFVMSSIAATLAKSMAGAPPEALPPFSMSPYVETKLWAETFTEETATALRDGGFDVRCRVLHPELVKTDLGLYLAGEFARMASEKTGQQITPDMMAAQMVGMTPSQIFWEPKEIGQQVVHLLKNPDLATVNQAAWNKGEYRTK